MGEWLSARRLVVRCLLEALQVFLPRLQRVEGHRAGYAGHWVLERPARLLAEQLVVILPGDAKQAQATAEPDVLAVVDLLRLQRVLAAIEATVEGLHAALGQNLDRTVKPLVAVVEVKDITGAPSRDMAVEPRWDKDRVGVQLHGPVEGQEELLLHDLAPNPREDVRVQGGLVVAAFLAFQGTFNDLGHDPGRPSTNLNAGIAENGVSVAGEEAHLLLPLELDELDLRAARPRKRDAEERGPPHGARRRGRGRRGLRAGPALATRAVLAALGSAGVPLEAHQTVIPAAANPGTVLITAGA
mmetsp:Transcript_107277/g.303389  ORF Transcript_107277/g.303389 Transcript_107277/m.303389 type:complete len:300 (-) Transcript_107277:713-1612(-)